MTRSGVRPEIAPPDGQAAEPGPVWSLVVMCTCTRIAPLAKKTPPGLVETRLNFSTDPLPPASQNAIKGSFHATTCGTRTYRQGDGQNYSDSSLLICRLP